MSKGWKEVARLGGSGARYPHVLVDAHGWCLRLGPRSRDDEKYFSSLPVLLRGLVEHFVRRRLGSLSSVLCLEELAREVRDALRSALELCQGALEKGGMEAHVRRMGGLNPVSTTPGPSRAPAAESGSNQAVSPLEVGIVAPHDRESA